MNPSIPDVPVQVPIDNPNADTEWNDILRKHNIIPEKAPDLEPAIQEALVEAEQRAYANRLEDKDIDELDALEDDEDEDFLAQYRNKRMAELNELQKASLYGQVYPLQKPDYAKDVTEASSKAYVFVLLTSSLGTNVESRVLTEVFREAATKYGEVKFCQIRADMCIENYPERNCPTVLIYKDGDIRRQIVTLREFNGVKTSLGDLERVFIEVGAIKENDMRLKRRSDSDSSTVQPTHRIKGHAVTAVDEDDDWD